MLRKIIDFVFNQNIRLRKRAICQRFVNLRKTIPRMNFNRYPLIFKLLRELAALPQRDRVTFNKSFGSTLAKLEQDDAFKNELTDFTKIFFTEVNLVNAYTDYGISSNRGFFQEIYSRIKNRILPAKLDPDELKSFIHRTLPFKKSLERLAWIDLPNWTTLISLIHKEAFTAEEVAKIRFEIYSALVILSHRFTNIGIDPYFVKRMPEIDDVDSPFFAFNAAVNDVSHEPSDKTIELSEEELLLLKEKLDKCEIILHRMEQSEKENGTSLHQIFLTKLSFQQVERIRMLIFLLSVSRNDEFQQASATMMQQLAHTVGITKTLHRFFKQNTQLLAYRTINHTSEKGEDYIGFSRAENRKLFKSALGGGLMVVLLVYVKHFIHGLHLSLFFEGLLFGLNYAAGFITMHLLHFTLATKQPAMTASYIASTLDPERPDSKESRKAFRQVISSQFVSLIGNLVVVLPVCFMITWFFWNYFNTHFFKEEAAAKVLYANHPLLSASLIYAFFTAIFLSLSGIITGLVDNKIQFSEIPYRIRNHPGWSRRFKKERLEKLANFTEKNGGAICGNLFLGLALGMAGNMGTFIGIPFDIRHITISAGNFGFALGSGWEFTSNLLWTVFAGVILIGLVNIIASFMISFLLACRSRGINWKKALRILVNYFRIN